ncbi:integral membrane protein [Fusarium austroafricanum]|uniref:Integral membrane protein n=1 Tax=Fusarium austroafricanum TaxID=2364996 RepID=A0A8H4JRH1_9HYPO|nr:integral membrane protein [Fusarium austroafricanum]
MAADSWEPVRPEGLALGLYITTVVFSVICTIVVGLRTYIRTRNSCIGTDDYLMCAGWAAYIGHNIVVSIGCHRGIGTAQRTLDTPQVQEANKYVIVWQMFYALTLALVKSSICVTVIRIATERKYVRILQALIVMSVALSTFGIIFVIAQCRPFEAHWIPSRGKCFSKVVPTVLTYAASVSNVITDFAVAVIPMCLVRKLQMRRKLKLYAQLIMALGMLASIASIVRIPYSNAYMKPENFVYSVANIILWTVVECGVGVVAGSLPSLRAFFKSLAKDRSTNDYNSGSHNTTDLLTIGRIRERPSRTTEIELGTQRPGSNESNDGAQNDDDSQRRIIVKVTKSFRVEERQSDEEQLCERNGNDNIGKR